MILLAARVLLAIVDGEVEARRRAFERNLLEQMGLTANQALLLYLLLPAVVLLLLLIRELSQFGIDANDPLLLRAGGGTYRLRVLTGLARNVRKYTVSSTYTSGGGTSVSGGVVVSEPVRSNTASSVHLEFVLAASDGSAEPFHLVNFEFPLFEAQELTVIRARRESGRGLDVLVGAYGTFGLFKEPAESDLLFVNHSAKASKYRKDRLRRVFHMGKFWIAPWVILAAFAGAAWLPTWAEMSPEMAFGANLWGSILAAGLAALLALLIVFHRRVSPFKRFVEAQLVSRGK
jgi:hypothetical protein